MDPTKRPLFMLSCVAFGLAFIVELGLSSLLTTGVGPDGLSGVGAPGIGIRYLALIDAALIYTLGLMAIETLAPGSLTGRAQGAVTFVLALLGLLIAILAVVAAIGLLVLMVTLLAAVPFGTAAYAATWGDFPAGEVRLTLGLAMLLKAAGAAFLVLASPSLLRNRGLLVLLGLSFGATFVVATLVSIVPQPLTAIADAAGAIVAGIVAAVWLVVMLIGAAGAVRRLLRGAVPG
jgi:hypothetical protein